MKTDFKSILREAGFGLSFEVFGRIVCLTTHQLRRIYVSDPDRFFALLKIAVDRWGSICKKTVIVLSD